MNLKWVKLATIILLLVVALSLHLRTSVATPQNTGEMSCLVEKNSRDNCWIAWSADGQWIAIAGGNVIGVDIWEANTGDYVRRLETPTHVFMWNPFPSQSMLLTTVAPYDYTARIWDVETGSEVQTHDFEALLFEEVDEGTLEYLPDIFTTIAWNPASNQIVLGSALWIGVWDTANDEFHTLEQPDSEQRPFTASWSPDGEYLALAGTRVSIYEADPFRKVKEFSAHHYFMNAYRGLQSIDWSPDGRYVITDGILVPDGVIRLYDVETGELTAIESHTSPINAVAWSPAGDFIASAGGDDFLGYPADNAIRIWDAEAYDLVSEIEYEEPITSISWKPDGTQLAAVDSNGVVYILDVEQP